MPYDWLKRLFLFTCTQDVILLDIIEDATSVEMLCLIALFKRGFSDNEVVLYYDSWIGLVHKEDTPQYEEDGCTIFEHNGLYFAFRV